MSQRKSQGKLENIKLNDNENTSNCNLREAANAVLVGKFIALNDYIGGGGKGPKLITQVFTFKS